WLIGLAMAGGGFFHLASAFPRRAGLAARLRILPIVGYAASAVVAGGGIAAAAGVSLGGTASWWARLIVGWVLISGFAYLCIHAYRATSKSPTVKIQSLLVAVAMFLGLLPLALWIFVPSFQSAGFAGYLALALVLPCLALGYSMFRFRVSDTTEWLRQGMTYGLVIGVLMLAYSLVVAGLTLVLRVGVPATSPWWVAGLSLAVALLVEPIRTWVRANVDRTFFRGDRALEETVRSFTAEITAAKDVDAIAGVIRRVLETTLQPANLHVFVRDESSDQYIALRDSGNRPTTELHFDAKGSLAAFLGRTRAVETLDQRLLAGELQPDRNRLTLLAAQLFIPLADRTQLLGWIALGPRSTGAPYAAVDVSLLEKLGEQAAVAIGRVQIVQNLERRLRDMNALTRVAQGVNITLTFDDVLELIYAQTAQIVPFTDFYITLRNLQTNTNSFAFALENGDRVTARENVPLPANMGLSREVLRRGRSIITEDYERECRLAGLEPETRGLHSWMGVPLNAGAEAIGILSVGSRDSGIAYIQTQLELLQAVADQTAGAIVKARLLRETQQRAAQLSKLNDVTRQVASTLEMTALRQVIVEGAAGILDCEAAIFYAPDQPSGELVVRAAAGLAAGALVGQSAPIGVGHVYRAAASRAPEIEQDLSTAGAAHVLKSPGSAMVPRSSMAVPLQFQDTLVGILEVLNRRDGGPFVAEDESLLLAFAGQAVVALENVRLYTLT
ncbi:MAG TPA: GAF domain-containing protein, partial [Anaerolineales bacterium]|nr:GAF domain-containing protein [Anaerolineales bacterium]